MINGYDRNRKRFESFALLEWFRYTVTTEEHDRALPHAVGRDGTAIPIPLEEHEEQARFRPLADKRISPTGFARFQETLVVAACRRYGCTEKEMIAAHFESKRYNYENAREALGNHIEAARVDTEKKLQSERDAGN